MTTEHLKTADGASPTVIGTGCADEPMTAKGVYHVSCYGADGALKWQDKADNLVTTAGKNHALDTELGGTTYTAAWYMLLISSVSYTGVPLAADTMASHTSWTEAGATNAPAYSQATRPAPSFSAASAGSKTTSSAVTFSITSSGTLKGCGLTTISTKDGTTGTLLSAGLFTGGDKVVANTDTVTVNYTLSM